MSEIEIKCLFSLFFFFQKRLILKGVFGYLNVSKVRCGMKNFKNLVFLMSVLLVVSASAMRENTASSASLSSSLDKISYARLQLFLNRIYCGLLPKIFSTRSAALTSHSCGAISSHQSEQVGVMNEDDHKAYPLKRHNAILH